MTVSAGASAPVLQVIAPAPFGGAESVARALARSYPGGAPLATLLQHGGRHPFAEQARAEGLPVLEIVGGRRRYDREVRGLRALIAEHRPSVLHTHIYHADFVGYFAARPFGIPVVAHVHGITGGDWKDRTYQWLDLRLLRRFDGLIAVSASVRARLLDAGCRPERIHLITNPYSPPVYLAREAARARLGIRDDAPLVGWIGRLNIEKGADLFVEMLAGLSGPPPRAVMIGSGPEADAVRRLVAERGLAQAVQLPGELPDAAAVLPAFDAVVLSSRTEGLPMALLETMGAGVPAVAFAVGGVPDALDERTGWMATAGDVSGLGRALSAALADPAEASRRARRAADVVEERFGAQVWIERVRAVHRAVLEARGQSA